MKLKSPMTLPPSAHTRPERWTADAGDADVVTLDIPPDLHRSRTFEIDCRLVVRPLPDARAPTHAMNVLVDGSQQWSRSIATANPGATDSLDYHFRRRVEAGQPLRVTVTTSVRGATRVRLVIEAEEN